MTYAQRKQNLEKKQEARENPATIEDNIRAVAVLIVIVMFIALMMSGITVGAIMGYMLGFAIVMLPLTLFFGTLKVIFK